MRRSLGTRVGIVMMATGAAAAGVFAMGGCGAPLVFHDAPIVWKMNDDRDIAEPDEDLYNRYTHYGDMFFETGLSRALSLPDEERALDVNALDEVPDSTWYENRIGRYELTPEDVARGPGGAPPRPPFTVKKGKVDGSNPGFNVVDADGRRFLIKLDPFAQPEMQTSNAAIASRLFWALGYHVPSEHVVTFSRRDLRIDPKATYDKGLDEDLPFSNAYLDELLGLSAPPSHGTYRAIASELLKGKPKGGFRDHGRRHDDPNDTISHERRRTLRGLQVFCAWLDHTDINPQNTLDMYVEEGGRRFLRHHLIDFGETLGAHGLEHPWMSYANLVDAEYFFLSFFAFGIWTRPWESDPGRPFRSVGLYFPQVDIRDWREVKPYYAFRERTDADTFWAAKIVMRFSREHIAAAVATAKMSDPAAAGYLTETLLARRRGVGLAYMTKVTALDRFAIVGDELCMVDLSVHYGLAQPGVVERVVDGRVLEQRSVEANGRVCVQGPTSAASNADYARYRLRTRRDTHELGDIEVHVRTDGAPRVVGVVRDF